MHTLIRGTVILTLLLSGLLVAILKATYRDSNRWAYLFLRGDGSKCASACLLGVDLDKMTFEEADVALRTHPFYISSKFETTYRYADNYAGMATYEKTKLAQLEIKFYAQSDESHADKSFSTVAARFYTNAPTLSDVILSLGQPNSVNLSVQGTHVWCSPMSFVRGRFIYSVYISPDVGGCFGLNQPVEVIYLNVYKPSFNQWHWLGFAPPGYYFREHGTPRDMSDD